ncbi:MAG TPA: endonuclease III [Puia sp.]|nr:endonuclease III [Puia sp.]
MATTKTDWPKAMAPLIEKYKHKKHPLDHGNTYQLLVMVVLSAQSRDDVINKIAPGFFAAWPDMSALATASPEKLFPYFAGVRNFAHKATWLVNIAQQIKTDKAIPDTQEELVKLPGIGRKSANVILREMHRPPEGVIVDIHVVRVAPRLGIVRDEDPKKIEEKLMKILPTDEWEAGMAMSFLGREICLPKPRCEICMMNNVCAYYSRLLKKPKRSAK